MPDIVATVGDPAANSYLSLEDADQAMDSYPNVAAWLEFEDEVRKRLLIKWTRIIDRFKEWLPATTTQALAFPTKKDAVGVIPKKTINALLECLDFESAGEMLSLKKLQAEGVTNRSILGQSSTFKEDRSELPAAAQKELMILWKSYAGLLVVQHPHRQMFVEGTTTRSPFAGDPVNPFDNGPLEPLRD